MSGAYATSVGCCEELSLPVGRVVVHRTDVRCTLDMSGPPAPESSFVELSAQVVRCTRGQSRAPPVR
jgi:hypothetical protein